MDEAQGFLVNTVIDDEVKLLEPKIIMTAEKAGRSTPMACGIMVVKNILSVWDQEIYFSLFFMPCLKCY